MTKNSKLALFSSEVLNDSLSCVSGRYKVIISTDGYKLFDFSLEEVVFISDNFHSSG